MGWTGDTRARLQEGVWKSEDSAAGIGVTSKTYRVTKARTVRGIEIIHIVLCGERADMQYSRFDRFCMIARGLREAVIGEGGRGKQY